MEPQSNNDEDFQTMLSDTVSGSVFMMAVAFAWRDIPQEKRESPEVDPLQVWDGLRQNAREMYLASARRFRDALIDVEDSVNPRLDEVMAA